MTERSVPRARIVAGADVAAGLQQVLMHAQSARRTVSHEEAALAGHGIDELLARQVALDELEMPFRSVAIFLEGVDPAGVARALRKVDVPHATTRDGVLFTQPARYHDELMVQLSIADHGAFDVVKRALDSMRGPRDLACPGRPPLRLSHRAHVMGVVNVTPDSFSDGGRFFDAQRAIDHARALVSDGADILDVGGESTRPGADAVDAEEELRRVIPVIEALAAETQVPISIDTMKSSVARAALRAGAVIVNDVSAGRFDPDIFAVAADAGAPIVLMHMLGEPRTMQDDPRYADVVSEVFAFLAARVEAAVAAGVGRDAIVVDPGFGFGKTREHNLMLLRRLREFVSLGAPVLAGTSRKRFIGATLDLPVDQRLEGTAATVAASIQGGASIVRVHDVGPMRRVAGMVEAVVHAADIGTSPED